MNQLELVQVWLSHFSYKPGVVITARCSDINSVCLDVRWPVRDWRNEQIRRRLICSYVVPQDISTAQQFFRWLDTMVLPVFDRHEHNEYFRIDGVAIFDPHSDSSPGLRSLDEEKLRKVKS